MGQQTAGKALAGFTAFGRGDILSWPGASAVALPASATR